jgi:hypothetical protein
MDVEVARLVGGKPIQDALKAAPVVLQVVQALAEVQVGEVVAN